MTWAHRRGRVRVAPQEHREEVPDEMVDADERLVRPPREPLGRLHAHEQRADEPRSVRDGDGVEISDTDIGSRERFADVRRAYQTWDGHVRMACVRNRLAPPTGSRFWWERRHRRSLPAAGRR